ncbi:hypothetical protein ACFPU1_14485 [Thalassorhabdus alkalitolerans]|uniref:Uncharacterized protein n=1 Tax=Thalassorhabdus alkalitolerans TaxID=2282697 RepID=A0ABW0YVA6_9BACI
MYKEKNNRRNAMSGWSYFLIMVAPFLIVGFSLLFLFLWCGKRKNHFPPQ